MNSPQEPRQCPDCNAIELCPAIVPRDCRVKHDGIAYSFVVPDLHVWKCRSCGELTFDDETNEQISQGLRDHLGLLSPLEIREKLKSLGLTQRALGEGTAIAEETISRWLNGLHIQGRVSDNHMRLFFAAQEPKQSAPSVPHTPEVVMPGGQFCVSAPTVSYWFAPTCLRTDTDFLSAEGGNQLALAG